MEPILETPDMDLGRRAQKSPREGTLSEQSAEGSVTRSQAAEMAERRAGCPASGECRLPVRQTPGMGRGERFGRY